MQKRGVSLKDIAAKVGVSFGVVSCVLNERRTQPARVSDKTRQRIIDVARELGYVRNIGAARMGGSSTKALGILLNYLTIPNNSIIASSFEDEALRQGYHCIMGCTKIDVERESNYIRKFLEYRVEGIMLGSTWHNVGEEEGIHKNLKRQIPMVFIDSVWENYPGILVHANYHQGGMMLSRHLIEMGHRRISFFIYENVMHMAPIVSRLEGIRAGMAAEGLDPAELQVLTIPDDTHPIVIQEALLAVLKGPDPPTAIMTASDQTALIIISLLKKNGYRVPGDLAVTGFDDAYNQQLIFNHTAPEGLYPDVVPLTTIRQPLMEIGKIAAEKLIYQIQNGAPAEKESIVLDVELIVRESSQLPLHCER